MTPARQRDRQAEVLVVGDQELVLEAVDERIRSLHDCAFASDPTAALEAASGRDFEAVVLFGLDHRERPDFGLLRALVAEQLDAAVVVVSGLAESSFAERAFALGAHSYLLTPLSSRQLEISISGRLRQRQSERTRVRSLHHFRARIEGMMELSPVPIFIKDRRGRYVFANAATHRCLDLDPGDLVGRTAAELLPPEMAGRVVNSDRAVLAGRASVEIEVTLNVHGEERTFLSNRFPDRDAGGATTGIFGMAIDISDRKASEAQRAAFAVEQRRMVFELRRSREETADRLSRALRYRDAASGEHVSRMAIVAAYLGDRLGLSSEEVILLRAAAPMHDVGKIAIADEILQKPGRLTRGERREMQRHTTIGHQLLADSDSPVLRLGAMIALTHHERFDGKGYPRGLKGEEIPLEGRIAAVADVFDSLLSDRPYRTALEPGEVRQIIADGSGSLFDPQVVGTLLRDLETALILRNAAGEVSDERLARLFEAPLSQRAC